MKLLPNIQKSSSEFQKDLRLFITLSAVVMIWRSVWNFMDEFLIPHDPLLSNTITLIIGLVILYFMYGDLDTLSEGMEDLEKDLKRFDDHIGQFDEDIKHMKKKLHNDFKGIEGRISTLEQNLTATKNAEKEFAHILEVEENALKKEREADRD